MIRRFAWKARQQVRKVARRALDRLDPPMPAPRPPAQPPTVEAPSPPRPALEVSPEITPNPLAVRYGLSRPVGSVTPATELGAALHGVTGVADVFGGDDFLTVTRDADADADAVNRGVLDALQVFG